MNFLPIFKYRLKDDLRAVAVFLAVTLLCMVLVIYGIMIMVAEMDDRVVSNFGPVDKITHSRDAYGILLSLIHI